MPERIQFPQWRAENDATRYPFSAAATLVNAAGRVIVEGTFVDAALYPVGAGAGLYVNRVTVDFREVAVYVGTPGQPDLAVGRFPLVDPPDLVALADPVGRPAGVLVSGESRLGLFQTWGEGTHEFEPGETEFAAGCVFPTPEVGVRAVRLATGELFVGDVWLVGGDGVVLRTGTEDVPVPGTCATRRVRTVRVDVVGDPLFRRRLCRPNDLFQTPRFVKTVRVVGPNMTFECGPDAAGNLILTAVNDLAADTVLRVGATADGIEIGAVGSALDTA